MLHVLLYLIDNALFEVFLLECIAEEMSFLWDLEQLEVSSVVHFWVGDEQNQSGVAVIDETHIFNRLVHLVFLFWSYYIIHHGKWSLVLIVVSNYFDLTLISKDESLLIKLILLPIPQLPSLAEINMFYFLQLKASLENKFLRINSRALINVNSFLLHGVLAEPFRSWLRPESRFVIVRFEEKRRLTVLNAPLTLGHPRFVGLLQYVLLLDSTTHLVTHYSIIKIIRIFIRN